MKTYGFFMVISGLDPESDDYDSRLYDAGCDDALVCVQDGTMFLDFDREAKTFKDAVMSAQADIMKAGAKVEQVWKR